MTKLNESTEIDKRNELIENIRIKVVDIKYLIERIERCYPDDFEPDGLTVQELREIYESELKGEFLLEMFRGLMIDDDDWETLQ